ncbi:MAG: hypothetical protein KA981_11265 [Bacteroidia bacterium]|jgi:hypothetical protein|nr:hypothetical protein [Bacteroidia bacterium]
MQSVEKAALIKLKVKALLMRVDALEKELDLEKKANENLRNDALKQTKRIEILEDKNKISKLADGIQLKKQDLTEVKLAINRYVREIDECLKLLNQIPNNN